MNRFNTIFKKNQIFLWVGVALVLGGEALPIHEFKHETTSIRTNIVQLLGFVFTLIPFVVWFFQRKKEVLK